MGGILLSDGLAEPGWWAEVGGLANIQLVVLMACESSDVADALIREGIPAVISVRREITERSAIQFVIGFYEAIRSGMSLARAVKVAALRLPLREKDMIDFQGEDLWQST